MLFENVSGSIHGAHNKTPTSEMVLFKILDVNLLFKITICCYQNWTLYVFFSMLFCYLKNISAFYKIKQYFL